MKPGDRCRAEGLNAESKLVFLVDDEPVVLMALSRSLAQQGYRAKGFDTPGEALRALRQQQPDCIVADYYMPRGNGVGFLKEVRQLYPGIARVVLTGGHVDERLRRALDDETVQVLVLKPWSLHTIHSMMSHVRARDSHVFLGSRNAEPSRDAPSPQRAESALGVRADNVLVVDHDGDFLSSVRTSLARIGYRCKCVLDANDILDQLRDNNFDVVLMNLLLDGRSGLDAIRLIRKSNPSLPVIAMTCGADREMAVSAFRQGATGFMQKPFDLPTLEDALRRSAQLGRLFSNYLSRPELSAIIELQHAIASGKSVPNLLDLLLQQMIRFTGAESASVMLVEPDGQSLRIAVSYGLSENVVRDERVSVGERVCGWVAEHNQPQMIIGSAADDPRLEGVARDRCPSVGLCLPMRGRDSLVGVLCLSRFGGKELFSRDSIDLGMLLSSEVARAIERAGAVEEQLDIERSVMRRDKLVTIGELASGVAHEINNPLGYVSSNMNSLKEYFREIQPVLQCLVPKKGEPDAARAVQLATEADLGFILDDLPGCIQETVAGIRRVLQIVNDLKNFTRDDMESREAADVNQVLEGAVNILWNQIKHRAKLTRDYGEMPSVQCYPSQLGQVFLNLLYNAVQAIEQEGEIFLRSRLEDDRVVVEVTDNGCGMSPEGLPHIFEPFYTTKPRGVGTGLGLSIARKIVERHGGQLTVTSILGKGSTFRVTLPVKDESAA